MCHHSSTFYCDHCQPEPLEPRCDTRGWHEDCPAHPGLVGPGYEVKHDGKAHPTLADYTFRVKPSRLSGVQIADIRMGIANRRAKGQTSIWLTLDKVQALTDEIVQRRAADPL